MKVKRKIVEIDEKRCDGCGQCVPACAEGAIEIIDGKARLVAEKLCDGLGACLGECPRDAIRIVEREAEEFDEEAVEDHLRSKAGASPEQDAALACECPSAQVQSFSPLAASCEQANEPSTHRPEAASALSHWPVQIRLVPPTAPFLKGADLLVVADCTPIAYPRFHEEFLKGKVVMVGCPKFDEAEPYIQKFAEIFRQAGIRSITVVVMEVPCCQGLPLIVRRGMEMAGVHIPVQKVVIGTRGQIIETQQLVA